MGVGALLLAGEKNLKKKWTREVDSNLDEYLPTFRTLQLLLFLLLPDVVLHCSCGLFEVPASVRTGKCQLFLLLFSFFFFFPLFFFLGISNV